MPEERIMMGVPDGHLYDGSKTIFRYMGFPFPDEGDRKYVVEFNYPLNDKCISLGLHRPSTIAYFVQDGILDIGITGGDNLYETLALPLNGGSGKSLYEHLSDRGLELLAELDYRPSSLVFAVHKESGMYTFDEVIKRHSNGKEIRVASEFPHITEDFLSLYRIKCNLIETPGKTETSLAQRIAGGIVEVVETGKSVIESGGIILTNPFVLERSTPKLIASKAFCKKNPEFIDDFVRRIKEGVTEYKRSSPVDFQSKLEQGLGRQQELYPGLGARVLV